MADGLFTLILFSIAMAAASFGAGMLPLAISLSHSQLRLISAIGMGVLVGTSLIVIIPEGIDTLYSAKPALQPSEDKSSQNMMIMPRWLSLEKNTLGSVGPRQNDNTILKIHIPQNLPRQAEGDSDGITEPHKHEHPPPNHAYVGIPLITGFILMYLIDQLPKHTLSPPQSIPYHIAIDNLYSFSSSSPGYDPTNLPSPTRKSFPTTIGLVIHAAADGIALGASSTSSSLTLEAIIFIAIMLHKAPAAFGLSAVLLRAGLTKRQARNHLIIFSLAAPAGALLTWLIITIFGRGTVDKSGMHWWTGILLLFSGGTFLYVAMHTMQDKDDDDNGHGHSHGREGGFSSARNKSPPALRDTVGTIVGMLLPLLTQIGHHHPGQD